MKLSELIKQLQAARAEYGDIETCVNATYWGNEYSEQKIAIEHHNERSMDSGAMEFTGEHILIS